MAQFDELRLTVDLTDNATVGLQRLRSSVWQLRSYTTGMTGVLAQATTEAKTLATATNACNRNVRALSAAMHEASRSADLLGDGLSRMEASMQGLKSMPQIAGGVRDMAVAVHGLGASFSNVGPAASVAVYGIGAFAVAAVAFGASVVAYGASVLEFALNMDEVSRTARRMGVSFADLKYAQDHAQRYGYAAETVIRSYQGIQDAQLDLFKNGSQLRERLIGQGVDVAWIHQLSRMDPQQADNAIKAYGDMLERQALAEGATRNVARALKYQFGREFSKSMEDMDMPQRPPLSPYRRQQLERIGELSEKNARTWREITQQSLKFFGAGLEPLRDALQKLLDLKKTHPKIFENLRIGLKAIITELGPPLVRAIPDAFRVLKTELQGVVRLFTEIKNFVELVVDPIGTMIKNFREGRDKAHPILKGLLGGTVTEEDRESWREQAERSGQLTIWDRDFWLGSEEARRAARDLIQPPWGPEAPSVPLPLPRPQLQNFRGGANDNNPLLHRISFSTVELIDETLTNSGHIEGLAYQVERLNLFFEHWESRQGRRETEGLINASLTLEDPVPTGPGVAVGMFGGYSSGGWRIDGGVRGGGGGGSGPGGAAPNGSRVGPGTGPGAGETRQSPSGTSEPSAQPSRGGGGSGAAVPGLKADAAQNAQRMYNELRRLGHSHEQASAALAHARAESSFNPYTKGDRGTAHGFFQHRSTAGDRRWDNLKAKAREWGLDPYSPEAAARFLDWEIRHDPANAGRGVKDRYFGARTTQEAVTALNAYERFRGWRQGQAHRYRYGAEFERTMRLPNDQPAAAPSTGQQPPQQTAPAASAPSASPAAPPSVAWPQNPLAPPATQSQAPPAAQSQTAAPGALNAPNDKPPEAVIWHHTAGRGTAAGVVAWWRRQNRGIGTQFIIERDGTIRETRRDFGYGGTGHMIPGYGRHGQGLSNQNTVGVEVIANNDKDYTPEQIAAIEKLAERYPNARHLGHGQVNPGHRQADEGFTSLRAIAAARARQRNAQSPPIEVPPPSNAPPPKHPFLGAQQPSAAPQQPSAAPQQPAASPRASGGVQWPDPPAPRPQSSAPAPDRTALTSDRAAAVQTSGKLGVSVTGPSGTTASVEGSGTFKKTELERRVTAA